ncbi:MAG: MBL fold metallo-hydrolase [Bacteroidales bacterium]|nr:MBL fold metallo-hydrolase [Bacteroidales bacterium]
MELYYIYHSCFVAKSESALIVFDYWKDSPEKKLHELIATRGTRRLYFVVSHFHEDHYNSEILYYAGSRLIVSYDTQKRRRIPKSQPVAILRPGDSYEDENLRIDAMRSTDVGIASLVTLSDGTTLYHAGDNNNWYFPENEEEHIRCSLDEMEGMFLSNLREVRAITKKVDYVMFPVDPRLGNEMLRGACQWLQQIETHHFYPMHGWERDDEVAAGIAQLKELFPEVEFEG